MSSKVLSSSNASRLEAEWSNKETTPMLTMADIIVNPIWQQGLVCKTIVINLPGIDVSSLKRYNKIVSRFPLVSDENTEMKYELVPYDDVEFRNNPNPKPYSRKILNKYMMQDERNNVSSEDRFLLGSDSVVNGYVTIIGYILLKTIKS